MEDKSFCGDVAQLGERGVRNAEARGSIPLISTQKRYKMVTSQKVMLSAVVISDR